MPTIKSFEELPVWKDARKFSHKIYNLTKKFPKKDFIKFLIIARGSISEIQNDLYIALDLKYINQNDFQETYALAKELGKQVNGFIKYLRSYDKNNSKDGKVNEEYCKYDF